MPEDEVYRPLGLRCKETRRHGTQGTIRCHELISYVPHTHMAWDLDDFLHYWHTTPVASDSGDVERD